jgi:hypothetical protein
LIAPPAAKRKITTKKGPCWGNISSFLNTRPLLFWQISSCAISD